MNAIRQTQLLNKRELENATPPTASWHADYRDTAYIYIGGLHPDMTEGDVVTIFSQFGNPTHLNLIRDRETGKSKGFAFLKYEDQRSCDLAVDNFTGADVLGRLLRVDHTRYKKKDDEDEDTHRIDRWEQEAENEAELNGNRKSDTDGSDDEHGEARHRRKKRRHMLKEEQELEEMLAIKQDGEDEDPMREYLIKEKREEVEKARDRERERRSRHKHRHRPREERKSDDEGRGERGHRHRRQPDRNERDAPDEERRNKASRDDRDDDDERRQRRHGHHGSHHDRDRHHKSHRDDSRNRQPSRDRRSRRGED